MNPHSNRTRQSGSRAIRARMNGQELAGQRRILHLLKPANINRPTASTVRPGPFELPAPGAGPGLALITGLLVVYPVFATLAITIASFWFLDTGPGA